MVYVIVFYHLLLILVEERVKNGVATIELDMFPP
jgi:hypothetical protein